MNTAIYNKANKTRREKSRDTEGYAAPLLAALLIAAFLILLSPLAPAQDIRSEVEHVYADNDGTKIHYAKSNCNDFSIGIELEGTDDQAYTDIQYLQLQKLVAVLKGHHPSLGEGDIVGHSDIAPGRKTDPGASFDWQRLAALSNDD